MTVTSMKEHVRSFFKESFPETSKKSVYIWLAIIIGFTAFGCIVALRLFRGAFDLGDVAIYAQLAHNLLNGEAIYKDFFHFRTPGSFFLMAFAMQLFGDTMTAAVFAVKLEVHVYSVLVFALAVGLFLRFRYWLLGLVTMVSVVLLPGYLSLRATLAFLSISFYIQSHRVPRYRYVWLAGAGIMAGITFIFGQDGAAMVLATVAITELCLLRKAILRTKLKEAGIFLAGLAVGLLPLALYILSVSDIYHFLHYTIYYAFVLQPSGMDVPFPPLDYATAIYFIVPIILFVVFYIFYATKKITLPVAILFIFVIARLISLFGRTDFGHLIFVLPDIIFITFFAFLHIKQARFDRTTVRRFVPFGIGFVVAMLGAMYHVTSLWIVACMGIVMLAFVLRPKLSEAKAWRNDNVAVLVVLTGLVAMSAYILYPCYQDTIRSVIKGSPATAQNIDGLNTDPSTFALVHSVRDAVEPYHPRTIFSYPQQAYFYTLAEHHATRFLSYEPETTMEEQDQTISDLERTKPEVIIFDPAQATGLSKATWKINNYITSHYQLAKLVTGTRLLWVMTPKPAVETHYLVFSIYQMNDPVAAITRDIQSPDKGIVNGVQVVAGGKAQFHTNKSVNALRVAMFKDEAGSLGLCGKVVQLSNGNAIASSDLCAETGMATIDLLPAADSIRLENPSGNPVIFNDAQLIKR